MRDTDLPTAVYDGFEVRLLGRATLLELFQQRRIFISVNPLMMQKYANSVKTIVNNHIGYIDGVGLCLAIWARGGGWSPRIAGSEIWLELIQRYPDSRYAIIGATSSVLDQAMDKLRKRYPHINVVFSRDGFFDLEAEVERIADTLRARDAQVVFLALGTPRQEIFAQMLFDRYAATYLGIGGSLDVYCGRLRVAPNWVKRIGLEWLWRWGLEPVKRTRMNAALVLFVVRALFVPVVFKRPGSTSGSDT